jgi:CHAD domain-containing protein
MRRSIGKAAVGTRNSAYGFATRARRFEMTRAATPAATVGVMCTVRQILVDQLGEAIAQLRRRARSGDAVHEVRKELKRARATLRLLRECIGVSVYRRDNASMRDAARPLTALREAKVLLQTQRAVEPRVAKQGSTFGRYLYRALRKERRDMQRRLRPQELTATIAALRAVKQRMQALSKTQLSQDAVLGAAVQRAYKSGRKAFLQAKRRPTDEFLHEWRKQTKYFSNQLEIISPLSPKRFAKRLKRSQRLAEYLGDDHDLALLNNKIFQYAKGPNAASRNDAVEELINRIARRRKALQAKAWRLGERLYAAKPARIRTRVDKSLRAVTAKLAHPQGPAPPRVRQPRQHLM